jgi:hypothetical protein
VDFDVSKEHDMLTLLKTKDIRRAWTDEHDKSMDDLLQSADISVIKHCATTSYEVKELVEAEEDIKVTEHAPEFKATFRSLRHFVSPDPNKTPAAKRQMKKPTKARKARRFVQVNTSEASRSHTRMSFSPSGRLIRSSNSVPKIPTTTVKSVPPIKYMLSEIEVLGVWTTEQAQAVANSMPKNPNLSRMVLRKRSLAEISPQTSPSRANRVTRLPVRYDK